MCNKHVIKDDVIVDEKKIEEVNRYVYLGKMIIRVHDQVQVLKRRIGQGWSASGKLDNILRDKNVKMRLKRKAFNECIFPVMTYDCETCLLSNTQLEKLVTTLRKMEKHDRSHPQRQKESKLNPETECCNRHYLRNIRESTHRWAMGETCGEEKRLQMDNQSHRMDTSWT